MLQMSLWLLTVVQQGLDWLARHQHKDGRWCGQTFDRLCLEGKCKGTVGVVSNVGLTGLALLAFLGDGHTLAQGKYQKVVRQGVNWLRFSQHTIPKPV